MEIYPSIYTMGLKKSQKIWSEQPVFVRLYNQDIQNKKEDCQPLICNIQHVLLHNPTQLQP
jgi:hypothetical protein